MRKIKYSIYVPAGNDTAIVLGNNYSKEQKKMINNYIMEINKEIEQVGFINIDGQAELEMAGGEFCGNATRSAIYKYLDGKNGEMGILVNSQDFVHGGIDNEGNVWCEIPIYIGQDMIEEKDKDIFIVKMKGITIVVIRNFTDKHKLINKELLKTFGKEIIKEYHLENQQAIGVIFCEKNEKNIKINPIVWVKEIDTLFYETACGSGSTAVGMVESYLSSESKEIEILQPSGLSIKVNISYDNNNISKAFISSKVLTNNVIYEFDLDN